MRDVVAVERSGRVALARCHGELDLATRARLSAGLARVRQLDVEGVVVDLSDVPFMDCSALNVVLALARDCARAGVGFALAGSRPIVHRMIVTLNLERVLTLVSDPDEAARLAPALAPRVHAD